MKGSLKFFATVSVFSMLAIAPMFLSMKPAAAQPQGLEGSYIGVGPSFGLTNGGQGNDSAIFGGNIQGRIAAPQVPVSLRGTVLFTDKNSAVIPTVTYDLPVAQNTNIYTGVGYSFVQNQTSTTPLGNRDSVVLTLGAESEIAKNVVTYGDVKYGINAYQNSSANALSVQLGLGYRF
ncbi:hypothetical protein BST81_19090 [Leptolyngbya sp. 'hensonii']|uniref:outer membrane beta-barrel protein n=1 Tax=Leptolyngbya sp. 'hensonii' TaxID=1922337 RepID=UPI00094F7AC6|nr:outer membrane beta-barrel protein [Leptolyngbya sp. 'hensonii']OLP16802.1 hypothetical protein BST81_19090 [Leptolyngbya sp. 'hensonii']